jgi:uncharacterized repeat protein (TIGR01451 family)
MRGDQGSTGAALLRLAPLAVALALLPARAEAQPFPPARLSDPAGPPVPVVALRVRVPAEAEPDRELVYRISVVNTSRAAAHHVTVSNPLPANVRLVRTRPEAGERPEPKGKRVLIWELGTLEPGARKELELVVVPDGSGREVLNCARVQFEHGQCVRTRLTKPGLRVRATAPRGAVLYDMVPLQIEVTNTGRAAARNVRVTDTLPEGWSFHESTPAQSKKAPPTWDLGDIAPGKTKRITYQAIPKKAGAFRTQVVVEAEGGLREESSASVRVGKPALTVALTGPKHRLVNRIATYYITVENPGTIAATNVEVMEDLPADIVAKYASPGAVRSGNGVRWSLGRLEAGTSRVLRLDVQARRSGLFKNVVTASADRGLSEQAKTETRFANATGLALEAHKGVGRVEVERELICTFRALNLGRAAATEVSVTIQAPAELKVVSFKGPVKGRQTGGKVEFDPLQALAPGVEAVYTVRLRGERAGEAKLVVEAISDQIDPGKPVKVEEIIVITSPLMPLAPERMTRRNRGPPVTETGSNRASAVPDTCDSDNRPRCLDSACRRCRDHAELAPRLGG